MEGNMLKNWLDNILKTEQPDAEIIAYYFGIFETTSGYSVYLIGSKTFDEDDEYWACNVDFVPKEKYFPIEHPEKDWEQMLEAVKLNLENYMLTPNFKHSFLDTAKAIATGFDDGDLIRLK